MTISTATSPDWFTPPSEGLREARWFAVDLHVPRREFGFLRLDEKVLESSSFLDNRIEAPWEQAQPVVADEIPFDSLPAANAAFLFHTSFCCSTLLARMLHLPPYGVALKEPLLLRRLADARYSGWEIPDILPVAARLLARPWHDRGAVLIKPTHVALNIVADLARALPAARGIVLTSTLEDFLVSNIKKSAETRSKVPTLAERALAFTEYHKRLDADAFSPPDFLSAVALQWCAQQEAIGEIIEKLGPSRLRVVHERQLLADMESSVLRCAEWLQWPAPEEALRAHVAMIGQRHAKASERVFDAGQRAREMVMLREKFDAPIRSALAWAERCLYPAMRSAPVLAASALT